MTITIATRADVRQTELDRFVHMSIDIVNSIPAMTGNLGVRHTNSGLSWFTLTAWSDNTALAEFVNSHRHHHAMQTADQLTHATAFARIHTDVPFDSIRWDEVREELTRSRPM